MSPAALYWVPENHLATTPTTMKRHPTPSPPRRSTRLKRPPPTGPISIAIHAPPRPRPPPRPIITHHPLTTTTTTPAQQSFYLPATAKSDLYTFFRADYARTGFRPTPSQLAAWFAYTHGGQQLPHAVVAAAVGGGGVVGRGVGVGVNMAVRIREWALARKEVVGCVPTLRECMEWMQRVGMVMRGDVDVEGVLRGVVDEEEEGGGEGVGEGAQRWVVLDGIADAVAGRGRRRVGRERGEGVVLLKEVEWRSCLTLPAARCGSHEAAMEAQGLANTMGVTGGWRDSERGESWDGSVYGSGDTEGGSSDGSSEETEPEDEESEPEDEKIRSSRRNTRFSTATTQPICFRRRSSTHSDRSRTTSPPVRRTRSSVKIEVASSRHRYRTRGKAAFKTEPAITPSTCSTTSRSCTVPRAARHTRLKQEHKRTTRNANLGNMAMAPALTKQYTLRSRRSQTFVTKSDDESGDDCSEDDADDEDEDGSSEDDEGGVSEDSMEDTIVIALPRAFAPLGGGGGTGAGGGASGAGTGGAGYGASCEEDEDGSEEEHREEQEKHTSYSPCTSMHGDGIPVDQDAAMNNPPSSLPDAQFTQEEEGSSQDTMTPTPAAPQPSPHATESVSGESGLDGGIDGAAADATARSGTLSGNDTDDDTGSTHSLQRSPHAQPLLVEPRSASLPLPDVDADPDADRNAQAAAARGGRYDRVVPDSEAYTSDAWTTMDTYGEWEDGHFVAPRIVVVRAFETVDPLSPGDQVHGTPGHINGSSSSTPPAVANAGRESTVRRGSAQSITNAPRPATTAAVEPAYEGEDEWSNMGETMVPDGGLSPADDVITGSLEGYAAAGVAADAEETETAIDWDLQRDTTASQGWWPAAVPEEHNSGLSGAWVLYTSPASTPTDAERGGVSMDDEEEEEEKDRSGDDSVRDVRAAGARANGFVDIAMQRPHRSSTGSYITARDLSTDGEHDVSAADRQCLVQQGEDRVAEGADRRSVPVDTAPGDEDDDEILTRWRKRKRALRHGSTRSGSSGSGGSGGSLHWRGALRGSDTAAEAAIESPSWQHFTGDSQEKEKLGGEGEEAPQWQGQWQWQWPSTGPQPLEGDSWNGGIEGQREHIVEGQGYMDGLRMGTVDGEGEGEGEVWRESESGAGALDARLWEWYGSVTGAVTVRELEARVESIVGGRRLPQGWLQGWVVRRGVSVREERGGSPEYPICLDDDEE